MVVRGMALAHSFPVAMVERPLTFNQDLKAFVTKPRVNEQFLLRWLESNASTILNLATDSTHGTKRIPTDDLLRVAIHLPPSTEQRVIAQAISDADALIWAQEAWTARKRAIKQAAMQQLLTGRTRLRGFSRKWTTRRLGNHVTFLRHGVNSRSELTSDGSVKYLHYGDVHAAPTVHLNPCSASMPALTSEQARSLDRLEEGDFVMVDASEDVEGVGKAVEVQTLRGQPVVAGLHTIAARFDKSVLVDGFKGYLQFCPTLRSHLRRLAAGTKVYATNRAHIENAELQLPGPDEQAAIAAALSDMDDEIAALERRLDKTRAIKRGMMQDLLTGRIRLPLPSEPPEQDDAPHA